MFPKFLIRKMYVKESLQRTENGFQFIVKNSIANGNVVEVFHLLLNDIEIPFENITIKNDSQEMKASKISPDSPIELNKGVNTVFSCQTDASGLIEQEVKVVMKFKVQVRDSNMTIDFDFKDVLRN